MGPQLRTDEVTEYGCSSYERQHEHVSTNRDTTQGSKNPNFLQTFHLRRKEQEPVRSRNKWMALVYGQFITLVATSMNSSSYLIEYGMHKVFPMFLLFNSYMVLTMHLFWSTNRISKKKNEHSPLSISTAVIENENDTHSYRLPLTSLTLRAPWYYYVCLSCLDIVPNYLTLLAMNKTSFTSATLLGSLTIPSTMIFCRLLLGKEYRRMHYVGVILCILGGSVTVFTDKNSIASSDGETSHPHSYGGDVLAILASLGYGVGDACAEFWSKHVNREEYLGMIGFFGAIVSLTASCLYERNEVFELFTRDNETRFTTAGAILWYIVSLVAYYVFGSLFLTKSDATLLNLSLQTSNLWAILFSIVVFRETPDPHFYVSILMVMSGVFVYELYGNNETVRLEISNSYTPNESSPLTGRSRNDRAPDSMINEP